MAINLDAALQARMDGIERTPVIELISSQFLQDIPFTGNYMNDLQTTEGNSSLTVDVNNRIVGTYIRGGVLYFVYTDETRIQFYETAVAVGGITPSDANVVPLLDGNIAIIFTRNYDIYRTIVSPTGEVISSATLIYNFTDSIWTSTPYAILLQNETYLMTVSFQESTSSNYFIAIIRSDDFITWERMTLI